VMDILFDYRFEKISRGLGGYLWRKIKSLIQGLGG